MITLFVATVVNERKEEWKGREQVSAVAWLSAVKPERYCAVLLPSSFLLRTNPPALHSFPDAADDTNLTAEILFDSSMARLSRQRQSFNKGDGDPPPLPDESFFSPKSSFIRPDTPRAPAVAEVLLLPEKPVRVYADGIYDLFHFGHAKSLEQAKKLFPHTYLLVGCCNDEVTHMYKGKTVMTEEERYESLRHCRWVDEVIPDAPWVVTQDFLDKHNIDYVAHDSLPYADASGAGNDVYEFVKAKGKFMETQRTDGVSTSDIIMRILKDYNRYVTRNLARGYSRKDLGVSYVKEKQLRVNMGITKLREKVKEHQEKVHKTFFVCVRYSEHVLLGQSSEKAGYVMNVKHIIDKVSKCAKSKKTPSEFGPST